MPLLKGERRGQGRSFETGDILEVLMKYLEVFKDHG